MKLSYLWRDLVGMIFPEVCEVCGRTLVDGESLLCLHCLARLPRTRYHLSDFNHMHERLMGKAHVERAAAWFFYKRSGEYSTLIHKAKYRGRPEIARTMARMYAAEIQADGFFDGIDMLLAVPMHRMKRLKRGYNQADEIVAGLSQATSIPVGDNLRVRGSHATQTRRNAYERYVNVSGLFEVTDAAELEGRHVLVVDDVFTTGSTLLACCEALREAAPTVRISVLTLASATLL